MQFIYYLKKKLKFYKLFIQAFLKINFGLKTIFLIINEKNLKKKHFFPVPQNSKRIGRKYFFNSIPTSVSEKNWIFKFHKTHFPGSMVINGLNTLQARSPSDYQSFSSDLFALFSKYRIH